MDVRQRILELNNFIKYLEIRTKIFKNRYYKLNNKIFYDNSVIKLNKLKSIRSKLMSYESQ